MNSPVTISYQKFAIINSCALLNAYKKDILFIIRMDYKSIGLIILAKDLT